MWGQAADTLALIYNVSGPVHKGLVTEWEGKRNGAMEAISISLECASTNNRMLSIACESGASLPVHRPSSPSTCGRAPASHNKLHRAR